MDEESRESLESPELDGIEQVEDAVDAPPSGRDATIADIIEKRKREVGKELGSEEMFVDGEEDPEDVLLDAEPEEEVETTDDLEPPEESDEVKELRAAIAERDAALSGWTSKAQELESQLAGINAAKDEAEASVDDAALLEMLLTGDEDTATKAIRKMRINPVQIESLVNERVEARFKQAERAQRELQDQQNRLAAIEAFHVEFKDIVENEALFRYADALTPEIKAEHPKWTYPQIFTEAGNKARELVEGVKESQKSETRRSRKAKAGEGVVRSINQRRVEPKEPPPKTVAEKIDDMKRARGQRV